MKRFRALMLLLTIILSIFVILPVNNKVMADEGRAKVYIICLDGVGGWVMGRSFNPAETRDGAIEATKFKDRYRIPRAHPKLGKSPPFYYVDYVVVSSWSYYKSVIESEKDVIIVNCHGEILPVPSGYTAEGWVDKIAEAMLYRKVTWVHTAGYPFYYYWVEGASSMTIWGTLGFKRLMQYISINDAECWPPGSESVLISLNTEAQGPFGDSWPDIQGYAAYVQAGRPLSGSLFKNYTLFPIWGTLDGYLTGAVIAFIKPSERLMPSERYGSGVYVHIGTNETFNVSEEPTGGDYWRGYVGAAAAIYIEVQAFKPSSKVDGDSFSKWGVVVTPVLEWFIRPDKSSNILKVTIKFGIYGTLNTSTTDSISEVEFEVEAKDCRLQVSSEYSKNGLNLGKTNLNVDSLGVGKTVACAALWIVSGLATGGLSDLLYIVDGAMIFSDWVKLVTSNVVSGVDQWAEYVNFRYHPYTTTSTINEISFQEFESIIHLDVQINVSSGTQWSIVPVDWLIYLRDQLGYPRLTFSGGLSIAVFHGYTDPNLPFSATIFFEDFEDGIDDWIVGDYNDLAGEDYWGISDWDWLVGYGGYAHRVWCAMVGNNSIFDNRPNYIAYQQYGSVEPRYDKLMDAFMRRSIDLRPYRSAKLRYSLDCNVESGDFLIVECWDGSSWVILANHTEWVSGTVELSLPLSAKDLMFRFISDSDDNVKYGAFLDNVEIVAELPNDANSSKDAGEKFSEALPLTFSGQANFAGYLNMDNDFYNFTITGSDISNHKEIYINLHSPQNTKLVIELYDPTGVKKVGPSTSIYYKLSSTDRAGAWTMRVYAISGFGQYDFDISIQAPAGAACPTLFVWNGTAYVMECVLNIHASSDVTVQHEITQSMVPENGLYKLQLRELDNYTSHIDQVKLYAVDENNTWHICPLIYAEHSELGPITLTLLLDDEWRVDLKPTQIISLKFLQTVPYNKTTHFIFEINGYNMKALE